ncbi:hypothetical protein [Streptomyces sp. NPDC059651]|uniref:hypothetical protein n=1 Tax=unclassified Streptomyces TaxID=2593676 RepID=UPI003690DF7B
MKAALIGSGPRLRSTAGGLRRLCPDLDRLVKPAAVSGTSTAVGASDYQARLIEGRTRVGRSSGRSPLRRFP